MATVADVKHYLATWFQVGKRVEMQGPQGSRSVYPDSVLGAESGYSPEFEQCWEWIQAHAQHCHLQGTSETVAELLSGAWDLPDCARCRLPVPMSTRGSLAAKSCPCADIAHWPNFETIPPRPRPFAGLGSLGQRLAGSP